MDNIEAILKGMAYIGAIAGGILAVLIFLGKAGLGGYFSKKGENMAMKEDLDKLTRITEGIRSDITLISDVKKSLYSDSKQAAIHCYECLSKFYKFTGYLQRLSIQTYEPAAIEEAIKRVHGIQEEYMEAFGRAEIYLQGSTLMTLMDKTGSAATGFKMACTMMAVNVQMKGQNLKRSEAERNEPAIAVWNNEIQRVREHFINEIEQTEKKYHELNPSLKKELHKLIVDPSYLS